MNLVEKAVPVPARGGGFKTGNASRFAKGTVVAVALILLAGCSVYIGMKTGPVSDIPVALAGGEVITPPYYITVDGKKTVLVESKDSAQKAINDVIEEYKGNPEEVLDIRLMEDASIEKMDIKNGDEMPEILNEEEAAEKLLTGNEGESYITVVITKEKTQHQRIEYEKKYKPDPAMYVGETRVETEGADGLREVTKVVVSENGQTVEEKVIASETIREPVQQTILTGTKNYDGYGGGNTVADEGTSRKEGAIYTTLTKPVDSICITSRFGSRWGTIHYGIDLGASQGSDIYAADSGTVYYAGYCGGYGNLIKIDHGNGMQTYYAHCSELLVSEGQYVKNGEKIGLVGSTGNSTGPHLHFEVIINGVRVDPIDFLDRLH